MRVRTTSGTSVVSPYMWRPLLIWLNNWSAATRAKSANMISTTTRMPSWAAPKPSPAKPPSEIGVLMIRSGEALRQSPGGAVGAAAEVGHLLAEHDGARVALQPASGHRGDGVRVDELPRRRPDRVAPRR